jgi:hypothetical protein
LKTLENIAAEALAGQPRPTAGPLARIDEWWERRLERLLAAPGTAVWGEMRENAEQISANPNGGARILYQQNQGMQPPPLRPESARLHLIGHSAGSIVHCHIVERLAALGWRFESVNFLAPAVRRDLFERTPILGLEKHFAQIERLGLANVTGLTPDRIGSPVSTHGGFDDDEVVRAAVVRSIRGARGPERSGPELERSESLSMRGTRRMADPIRLDEREREQIRLAEEVRAEIRATLGGGRGKGLREQLLAPALLILLTALVSGIAVPYVLRGRDERLRRLELESRLVDEVNASNVAAQLALLRHHEQMCDDWVNILAQQKRRAILRVTRGRERESPDAREQREAIAAAIAREHELRIASDEAAAEARLRYKVEKSRVELPFRVDFGDPPQAATFHNATAKAYLEASSRSNDSHQDALAGIYREANRRLQVCSAVEACEEVADDASRAMEEIRDAQPDFDPWVRAVANLTEYVIQTEPEIR